MKLWFQCLADTEERVEAGHVRSVVVRVRETRLTNLFSNILIGISMLFLKVSYQRYLEEQNLCSFIIGPWNQSTSFLYLFFLVCPWLHSDSSSWWFIFIPGNYCSLRQSNVWTNNSSNNGTSKCNEIKQYANIEIIYFILLEIRFGY